MFLWKLIFLSPSFQGILSKCVWRLNHNFETARLFFIAVPSNGGFQVTCYPNAVAMAHLLFSNEILDFANFKYLQYLTSRALWFKCFHGRDAKRLQEKPIVNLNELGLSAFSYSLLFGQRKTDLFWRRCCRRVFCSWSPGWSSSSVVPWTGAGTRGWQSGFPGLLMPSRRGSSCTPPAAAASSLAAWDTPCWHSGSGRCWGASGLRFRWNLPCMEHTGQVIDKTKRNN